MEKIETFFHEDFKRTPRPARTMTTVKQLYDKLITYPVLENPTYPLNHHEMIRDNLRCLIPNVDIGLRHDLSPTQIREWIGVAQEYSRRMNNLFQSEYTKQLKHLALIEQQQKKMRAFNLGHIDGLPDDLKRHIYGFVLPENKLAVLEEQYPNLDETLLKKLPKPCMVRLLRFVHEEFYSKLLTTKYMRYVKVGRGLSFSYMNKPAAILAMKRILHILKNADPASVNLNHYFQSRALRLMKLLVHVAYYWTPPPYVMRSRV